jgi:RNA recognition motif-containing protein
MGKRIYVGGLPYAITDQQLQALFSAYGIVEVAQVIVDKFSGSSRGFGVVEMGSDSEAAHAIAALNGTELEGTILDVNEAKPKESKARFDDEGRSGGRGDQRRGGGRGRL